MGIGDTGRGQDGASVQASVAVQDSGFWHPRWTLEKRDGDWTEYIEDRLPFWAKGPISTLLAGRAKAKVDELKALWKLENEPYEVIEFEGNALVNIGIEEMLELLIAEGGGELPFSNANASIGVGNGNDAEDPTDVDLQGASKFYQGMVGGYPAVVTTTVTFQADVGAGDAQYAWEEVAVFNNVAGPAGEMLNRKKQSLGTKGAAIWTISVAITIT